MKRLAVAVLVAAVLLVPRASRAQLARIKFTQGATVGSAGFAMKGVTGTVVSVGNGTTTGIGSWQIEMLWVPGGSAIATGVLAYGETSNTPLATFTPDVVGTYRVREKLWISSHRSGNPGVTDIRWFSVPGPNRGLVQLAPQIDPPPNPDPSTGKLGNSPNEANFPGNSNGWLGAPGNGLVNDLISLVDQYLGTGAGGGGGGGPPSGPAGGSLANNYPNPSLAPTGVSPGGYGDGQHVATYTVGNDGRLTAAGSSTIAIGSTAITDSTSLGRSLVTAASVAAAQAAISLVPGTNVQVYDSDLAAIAALSTAADKCIYFTGAGAAALYTCSAAGRTWAGLVDASAQTAALNAFSSSLKGLAPASGGGTTNFLRADGAWAVPAGGGAGIAATTAESSAPGTPGSGNLASWADSTDHRFHDKDSSGNIGTTVRASTAGSNQVATGISSAGVVAYTTATALAFSAAMSDMATFSSSTLAGRLTDETGTGPACFAFNPTLTGATMAGRLNLGDNPIDCGTTYHNDGNKTGASPVLADFSTTCNTHFWVLTGDVTGTPTWTIGGAKHFEAWVCQDATGTRHQAWPTSPTLVWAGDGSAPVLSPTPNACDVIDFTYNGTTIIGQAVASGSSSALPLAGGTMSGPIAMGGNNITNIQDASYKAGASNITGANPLLADWTTGNVYVATATGSMSGTPTFTAPTLGSGQVAVLRLLILQNGTGGFSLPAWPAGVKWQGTAPSIPTAANAQFWVTFVYYNSTYYGSYGQSAVGWN